MTALCGELLYSDFIETEICNKPATHVIIYTPPADPIVKYVCKAHKPDVIVTIEKWNEAD